MIEFTNIVHIARSVEAVYAYLSDLEHTPEWNWAITETRKITPGPAAVGTRYRQTRSVPRSETEFLELTDLVADRRIEVTGTLAGISASLVYRLQGEHAGTELTNTVYLETEGPLRLIAPLAAGRVKRAVAGNLDELKTLLEKSGSTPRVVPANG